MRQFPGCCRTSFPRLFILFLLYYKRSYTGTGLGSIRIPEAPALDSLDDSNEDAPEDEVLSCTADQTTLLRQLPRIAHTTNCPLALLTEQRNLW
jgi:hypothetical protein